MIKLSPSRLACLVLALWMPLHAAAGPFDDDEARKAILDLRTKVETSNTQSVRDGDIDKFIEASLKMAL